MGPLRSSLFSLRRAFDRSAALRRKQSLLLSLRKQLISRKMPGGDIVVRVVEPKDQENVLDFLRKHYYPEEPLTVGLEPKEQDVADEEFNMSNIKHGTCLMAVQTANEEKQGVIVGAVLAGPKDSHEAEHLLEEVARLGDRKWGITLRLLARVERETNVCVKFNVDKALHAHVLAVDSCLRGRAIGACLMLQLLEVGKKLGYPLLSVDCTSVYSARLCERLNMEHIYTIRYADYLDEQGKQVFQPPAPHDCLKTFVQRLL